MRQRGEGGGPRSQHRYDAFISYAHTDDAEGLATLLQTTLRSIGKPWYRRSALRVFRDQTALSASPGLWGSITRAMEDSAWFVLVASPAAAASPWVDKEVGHWLTANGPERLLTVVVDGTWIWNPALQGFDPSESTAVPPSLVSAFAEEPRHIDLRWAREEPSLTARTPRWRDQIAELAAPIHGVGKDDLTGMDLREHRRTLRIARGAAVVLGVLALVAAAAAVSAVRSASEARRNERAATEARNEAEYRRLVAQSRDLRRTDRELALLLAVEARHLAETPEADGAVQAAILEDPRLVRVTSVADGVGYTGACAIPGSGRALMGSADGTFSVLDLASGELARPGTRVTPPDDAPSTLGGARSSISCDVAGPGRAVLFSATGKVWVLDLESFDVAPARDAGAELNQVALSPDGRWIAGGRTDGRLLIWPVDDPTAEPRTFGESDEASGIGVAFSPDGSTLVSTTRDELRFREVGSWTVRASVPSAGDGQSGGLVSLPEPSRQLSFDPSGRWLLDNRRSVLRVHDGRSGAVAWEQVTNFVSPASASFDERGDTVFLIDDSGQWTRRRSSSGEEVGTKIRPTDGSAFPVEPVSVDSLHLVSDGAAELATWALDGRTAISRVIDAPDARPSSATTDGSSLLAVAAGPNVISEGTMFDTATGTAIGTFPSAAFATAVGQRLVAGFFLDPFEVSRWDVAAQRYEDPSIEVSIDDVVQASSTPGGDVAIAYGDGTVRRFDRAGRELGRPLVRSDVVGDASVVLSADGRYLGLSSGNGETALFDGRTGEELLRLHATLLASISVDRHLLALLPSVGRLELRDLATGEIRETVEIDANAYDANAELGRYLFASDGLEIQLYDWDTLRPVGVPFPGAERPLPFDDGRRLATTNLEVISIWDLDPDRWEEAACEMAGRNLTRRERATYLPPTSSGRPTCPGLPFEE